MLLLKGKEPAQKILDSLREDVRALDPKLVVIQVGNDPSSESYIRKKLESCAAIGMRCEKKKLSEQTSAEDMLQLIRKLNEDPDVTGFIIQLPLPAHLEKQQPQLFREIDPKKDVDGFTAYNVGKLFLAKEFEHLPPATPAGVIELLQYYRLPIEGKHAVVVGQSNIVGKPLSIMLMHRGATVTMCHDKTLDLARFTKQADILISAVGKPGLITRDMVSDGVVVIDVGITKTEQGLLGDVDFYEIAKVASAITPVPGGVGPMTVACLLRNLICARRRQI